MTIERVLAQLQALPLDRLLTWAGLALALLVVLAFILHRRRQQAKRNIGIARLGDTLSLENYPMAPITPSIDEDRHDPLVEDDIETIQKTVLIEKRIDPTHPDDELTDVLDPIDDEPKAAASPVRSTAPEALHMDEPLDEPPFTVTEAPKPKVPLFPPFECLKTLPFVLREGLITRHIDLLGISVEAVFFPSESVNAIGDTVLRLVPFLPEDAGTLICREQDRRTFAAGPLFAQPDAVIALSNGLLSVEYKSRGGRFDNPDDLLASLRPKDLLQTVIEAMVLSASERRPVAPILRTHNAVYFLRPTPAILALLTERLDAAVAFISPYAERSGISASDYASLCLVPAQMLNKALPGQQNAAGEKAHREMLR